MKICYLTHNLEPGSGWGRYAAALISGVKARGHEVCVLKEIGDDRGGFAVLRRGPLHFFTSILRAYKYTGDCDIIHALDVYPYGIWGCFLKIMCSKRLVLNAQGTYAIAPLYHIKTAFLTRAAYLSADRIVAISNYTKHEIEKKIKNRVIDVIPHGINIRKFAGNSAREGGRENFILSVGALKKRKGYHISIPAFALAKKEFPGLKYKIVGSQNNVCYFNELKKIAGNCGIERDVEFFREISDNELIDLYRRAKLFLLTSINHSHYFEGFGLVFLEAAAAGLPVIGTFGNGIEDAVNNGFNGILVEQGSIEQTAQAINAILSDGEKWENMSKNGYAWAKEHSLEKMTAQYISLYQSLL